MKKLIGILLFILLLISVSFGGSLIYKDVFKKTIHDELSEYYISGNIIPSVTSVVGARVMVDEEPLEGANFVSITYRYLSDTVQADIDAYLAMLVDKDGFTESPKRNPDQTKLKDDLYWQAWRRAQNSGFTIMVQAQTSKGGYAIRYSMSPRFSMEKYDFGEWRNPSPTTQDGKLRDSDKNNLSTDTWSSSFNNRDDKLSFLSRYLVSFSEILDAEYHIFYADNSKGLVPGPSYWDIRAALKVKSEDIPKWLDGYSVVSPDVINLDWWAKIRTDDITWTADDAKYYKRPNRMSYIVVFAEKGILLKRVTVN